MASITVPLGDVGQVFTALGTTAGRAGASFSVLAVRTRPARPQPPTRLTPGLPHCWYCYSAVEWARMRRIDRDRRRVHRRAVRRHKRLPPVPRQWTYFPRVFVEAASKNQFALRAN